MTEEHASLIAVTGKEFSDEEIDGPFTQTGLARLDVSIESAARNTGTQTPICVVPMTLGRDPNLVAESARVLRWVRNNRKATVCLARPFGDSTHLVSWLRAAVRRSLHAHPSEIPSAEDRVLIYGPEIDAFQGAHLYRVARLVERFGGGNPVEVAFTDERPHLSESIDRCIRLGAKRIRLVPAMVTAVAPRCTESVVDVAPLLGPQAISAIVHSRRDLALAQLAKGDDGIADGLQAGHHDSFAHSHGGDHEHTHQSHDHTHSHHHAHHH